MLIKLRNIFYQVECDAFANLATELLDIRPNFRRAMPLAPELGFSKTIVSASGDAGY